MKKCIDGVIYEMTAEEIAAMKAEADRAERDYWQTVDYGEAVHAEIRKRYTESQEFAILRQKEEKQSEYAAYFAYCEECKELIKSKKAEYSQK